MGIYFKQATSIPTFIGQGFLTEEGKVPVQCVLYKCQQPLVFLLNFLNSIDLKFIVI